MTYLDDESQQQASAPVELYRFIGPTTVYRYTSSESDITAFGDLYPATPTLRSKIVDKGDGDPNALSVTIPINAAISQNFAFAIPASGLELTVFRYHPDTGTSAVYWKGPVTNLNVQNQVVVFRIPSSLGALIKTKLPRILYQELCNNILFDPLCAVVNTDNREQTEILTFSTTEKTLTVLSMGAQGHDWAKGGYIEHVATGQKRMIISQSGTIIEMLYAFQSASIGDDVEVFAGCDHKVRTCLEKFSNKDRFNGFPYIPSKGAGYQE